MGMCSRCDCTNPDSAAVCVRCGEDLDSLAALTLTTLLPAPMVEPIHTPPKPPPDSKPLPAKPALTVPFGALTAAVAQEEGSVRHSINWELPPAGDSPTMASELGDCSMLIPPDSPDACDVAFATVPNTLDRLPPGGTLPARPGLHEPSMNDAPVQPSPPPGTECSDTASISATPAPPPPLPKLVVLRGVKINAEYPIYEGRNTVGRFADKPVDIDLLSQESLEQIWCSRQHAVVTYKKGVLSIEDLNSLNGTWVNGGRVHAGQARILKAGDIVQIGTVQMKVVVG
jgi:hypothetical protein